MCDTVERDSYFLEKCDLQIMASKELPQSGSGTFEKRVNAGLLSCGIDLAARCVGCSVLQSGAALSLGAAVSGGADSVAMLVALTALCKKYDVPLFVVTVNHNIRAEDESAGDALFVSDLCKKLSDENFTIHCIIKEIPRGAVAQTCAERGGGTEDAARFLRYALFGEFAKESGVDYICLAHTIDDNVETVLMRFLQVGVPSGIKRTRGIFARPLLDICRDDIENYLRGKNISWRTDSTNAETNFLRNRIRHNLVPRLDEIKPGWRRAVLSGAARAHDAEEAVALVAHSIKLRLDDGTVFFELESFANASRAARVYAVYKAINKLGVERRVPYSFVAGVADLAVRTGKSGVADGDVDSCYGDVISAAGIEAGICESQFFVKKLKKQATDFGFYVIIDKEGEYILPFGIIEISAENINNGECVLTYFPEKKIGKKKFARNERAVINLKFPFCVRSRMSGDEVACADGSARSVSDIFAAWKIPLDMRDFVPLVQDLGSMEIVALLGGVYGFDDWIVKETSKNLNQSNALYVFRGNSEP